MRTLITSLATAIGLVLLAAAPANAGTIPVIPKANLSTAGNGITEQVHWRHHRHHRHHYGYYPRYRYYDSYSYPRYRSYGFYAGPGFSLHIGPRHRWGHHRRYW